MPNTTSFSPVRPLATPVANLSHARRAVQFGVTGDVPTDTVESSRESHPAGASPSPEASTPPQQEPVSHQQPAPKRWLGDRSRAILGILLGDIVPPLLGFSFLAGPVGWMLTAASFPISYGCGKLAKNLMKDVNPANLPTGFQHINELRDAFHHRENLKEGELVDKWNQTIDNLLNIKTSRFQWLFQSLGNNAKLSQTGFIGKIFNNPTFLKAKMYTKVSQANSMGEAMGAGAQGGLSFWFYQTLLPGLGKALERLSNILPGPLKLPFRGLGWLMDHFPMLKLVKDMMSSPAK